MDVAIKHFNGIKLYTDETIITIDLNSGEYPIDNWDEIQSHYDEGMLPKKLVNPGIQYVFIYQYPICNKNACRWKLNTLPGMKAVRCDFCNRLMFISQCLESVHADVEVKCDAHICFRKCA